MSTYHFIAASEPFLTVEEPLEEVLRERTRHYGEQGKAIDFWLVKRPSFLEAPRARTPGGRRAPASGRRGFHGREVHHLFKVEAGIRGVRTLRSSKRLDRRPPRRRRQLK